MKTKVYLFIILLSMVYMPLMAQKATNVQSYQRDKNIVITYYLNKEANIDLFVSTDGGKTYSEALRHVSGDVGKQISAGYKTIVWNVLAEQTNLIGKNIVFKVEATPCNTINGHEYVDLGLSVKWATCNVGATKPEELGEYYAFGETRTKQTFTEDNYTFNIDGLDDYGSISGSNADVAHIKWKGTWRMPTRQEYQELINNCMTVPEIINGTRGVKFIANNGNSIFLPCAGVIFPDNVIENNGIGTYGVYWSGTNSRCAMIGIEKVEKQYTGTSAFVQTEDFEYFAGGTIRPVTE